MMLSVFYIGYKVKGEDDLMMLSVVHIYNKVNQEKITQ